MEIKHDPGRMHTKTWHGEAELLYKINRNIMSIYHTFVPDEDRGMGIAEKLANEAFGYAIKNKLQVSPDCPYIKRFLEKHEEMRRYAV